MIAALMVNTMVATVEAILEAPPDDPLAEQDVIVTAEKQLRLIVLAIPHWLSAGEERPLDPPERGSRDPDAGDGQPQAAAT